VPRIATHELGYRFERILRKALRGRKNLDGWLAEWVPELISEVPSEAYEEKSPADAGVLFLHADITEKSVTVVQEDLVSAHLSLKQRVRMTLNLSTTGGDTGAALALMGTIYDLRRQGRDVDIVIRSLGLSSGSIILQAATRRIMESHAYLLLHEPHYSMPDLTFRQHSDELKMTALLVKTICEIYASRSKHDAKFFEDLIERRDVYLTAREALAYGLVDEVLRVPLITERKAS
jgi:ATP-dependent protease ClpP protease subunit